VERVAGPWSSAVQSRAANFYADKEGRDDGGDDNDDDSDEDDRASDDEEEGDDTEEFDSEAWLT
jgi:hypothetical protein